MFSLYFASTIKLSWSIDNNESIASWLERSQLLIKDILFLQRTTIQKKRHFYGQMVWRETVVVIWQPFSIVIKKVRKMNIFTYTHIYSTIICRYNLNVVNVEFFPIINFHRFFSLKAFVLVCFIIWNMEYGWVVSDLSSLWKKSNRYTFI